MANSIPKNAIKIVLHPSSFEVQPQTSIPVVEVPWQPLQVCADWNDNRGTWASVTVRNFRVLGAPPGYYKARPDEQEILAADSTPKEFLFDIVPTKMYCKYDVVYKSASALYTVDPVIILSPAGYVEEGGSGGGT
jgi:hypothetical protein